MLGVPEVGPSIQRARRTIQFSTEAFQRTGESQTGSLHVVEMAE